MSINLGLNVIFRKKMLKTNRKIAKPGKYAEFGEINFHQKIQKNVRPMDTHLSQNTVLVGSVISTSVYII